MDGPQSHLTPEQVRPFLAFLLDIEGTIGGVVDTDLRYRWLQNCQFDLATTDVSGRTNDELFAPELADPLEAIQHEALAANARIERIVTVADPDGPTRYRVVAEPINAETPAEGVVFAALDASTQYRSLQRTTDAAYTIDRDWTITYWNDQVASRTGIDPEEIIGRNFWDAFGTEISAAAERQFRRAMDTGEPVEFEEYVPEPFDYWIEVRVFGDASGLLIHSRDITVRKRYERRLAEQRDAFETLNQLLRHDIRNDLQVALGYLELLAPDLEGDAREHAETVQRSLTHAVDLTSTAQQMAETIMRDEDELRQVRVDTVLQRELNAVREAYPEAVVLTDGTLPSVTALADELLESIFRNLLKNAIQHNDKTPPEVVVSLRQGANDVTVVIADNGPGIPADVRSDLFEKGVKGEYSTGTGIGLYLVRVLVDAYDGTISIKDNSPAGTQIAVTLPTVSG